MNAYEQYYKLAELRVLLHICRSFWGPYELKEDCGSYGLVPGLMAVFENGISVEGEGAGGLLKNLDEVYCERVPRIDRKIRESFLNICIVKH